MMRRFTIASLAAGLVLSTVALPAAAQEGGPTSAEIACPGGAPDAGFRDVSRANVHSDNIDCGVDLGVIFGLTSSTYGPERAVTRGQAASLIARALDTMGVDLPPASEGKNFGDVPPAHRDNVRRLSAADIVRGFSDGSFGSGLSVRRDQLATMYVRTIAYIEGGPVAPDQRGHFTDVKDGVHAPNIDAAYEYGIVNGKKDGSFAPRATARRDQAASVVINFVALLVDSLEVSEVTLLHDTHFHGKYEQSIRTDAGSVTVDIARYFALVQERKDALGGNALFLANGDDLAPSVHSGLFEPNGIHMVDAMNEAPVDVNTFGNHEFDYGPANLRSIIAAAEYPYVTANVRDITSGEVFGADLGVEEFITYEVDGVTVGITGLAPEGMDNITTLGPDTQQIPAAEALDIVVPKMEDAGVDIVVVTSHLCGTDAKVLADTYEGVDIIAGDHCGVYEPELYFGDAGAVVSLSGDEYQFLSELTLTVVNGVLWDVERTDYTMIDEVAGLTPIAAIQTVVDSYNAQLDAELNVVIGERAVVWDTRTGVIRTQETAAGNFFTDQMREAFGGSDIAVTNSGGIRGNTEYPIGDITRREIAEIFPFGNRLVQAEISGATLLEALEHSVSAGLNDAGELSPFGGFLQVSGIEFTFDRTQPAGDRVVDVDINGAPLDPTATYTMATNDFTLGGGDGYEMFEDLNVLVDANAGPVLDSYLMDRIENHITGPITQDVESRIVDLADAP